MKKNTKIVIIVITSLVLLILFGLLGYLLYMKNTYLSKDVVKEIVLNDTKLNAKDVTFKDIELDNDDGLHKYEVDFYYNRQEYSYEIDAKTGKIIYSNYILDNVNSTDNLPKDDVTSNNNNNQNYITKEEATNIALNDVNLALDNVTLQKAEFDYDNGIAIYEIEFINGNLEYDYEINAITKEIISKKQERR